MITASGFIKKSILLRIFSFMGKRHILVDAGCSGAILSSDLDAEMKIAIDLSLNMSPKVRRNSHGIVADLNFIPLKACTVDCIVCLDVIEHIVDDVRLLQNFYSIMKDRGFLILTTPIKDVEYVGFSLLRKICRLDRKTLEEDFGHVRSGYQLKELKELLEDQGFKIIFYETFNGPLTRIIDLLIYRTILKAYCRGKAFKETYTERRKFKRGKIINFLEQLHDLAFPLFLGSLIKLSEKCPDKIEHFVVCQKISRDSS